MNWGLAAFDPGHPTAVGLRLSIPGVSLVVLTCVFLWLGMFLIGAGYRDIRDSAARRTGAPWTTFRPKVKLGHLDDVVGVQRTGEKSPTRPEL